MSEFNTTSTQTFCGKCNHPMHWAICGAGLVSCFCRNDESIDNAGDKGGDAVEGRGERGRPDRVAPVTGEPPTPAPSPALTREALLAAIPQDWTEFREESTTIDNVLSGTTTVTFNRERFVDAILAALSTPPPALTSTREETP